MGEGEVALELRIFTKSMGATDYKKWVGGSIMFTFGVISFLRWATSKELFFLLLSLREFIVVFFLIGRERAQISSSNVIAFISYLSSGLPLLYLSASQEIEIMSVKLIADLLTIIGFLIVTWATIDLGTKFGVSPAKRGHKTTKGLYRFVNHPMYFGYGIAQLGWVFINKLNILIYIPSLLLFAIRAKAENKILSS